MPYNVIVICLDTFRADMIGPDRKLSYVETPNLDALAYDAVSFERAFGEGQPTLQMRRAFFTGRRSFPWRYNFDRRGHWHHAPGWHKIPPDQDTLAEVLLDRGYYTGLVADTYHMFKPTMNYTRGFASYDFIRGQETDNWRGGTLAAIAPELERYTREPMDSPRIARLAQYLFNQADREGEEDYQCARVFRAASRWLDDNAANAPFFLWVDSFDPHEPWDPPRAYADRYWAWPGEANPQGQTLEVRGIEYIYPDNVHSTAEEKARMRALYFGEVTFVDKWAGAFLDKVDALNLWDDTIVVLTSDHGTQLLDRGSFGKGAAQLHPFNTRIPLYIRHPEGPRGTRVKGFVQSHDLMPTLLRLLGIPYANVDGQDAWALAMGQTLALRDHIVTGWASFSNGNAGARACVRDDAWAYITSVHEEDAAATASTAADTVAATDTVVAAELYDLAADPDELVNVHDEHPDIVAKQRARLEAVVGQRLPAQLNEVCDPSPAPLQRYYSSRR